ncbi:MAG: hypothetical protein Unbinned4294contig1002_31 [Prokaryotic dsDNA virus sp.]|nr:MAG: hypothetical protein Unbinned4294contig1002_31 [Prokaryotic dsDNA virus sp.]
MTNQAVQVVPGKNFVYQYGNFSCQGTSLTISPFLSTTVGWSQPYESYYNEPVYDTLDLVGAFDEEGNAIPDGVPDNPGNVLFYRPIRTGQKNNYSINGGITATISIPLDRSHIKSCHRAAEKQVALLEQQLADKRLNYEIARLKNCGEMLRKGISFHPKSPYRGICADVVLTNPPGTLLPHIHSIPTSAKTAETFDAGTQTQQQLSSPASP